MSDRIEPRLQEDRRFPPPSEFSAQANVRTHAEYTSMHSLSLEDPARFWKEQTLDLVFRETWKTFAEWERLLAEVRLEVLDRHLKTSARTRAAIVFEGEPGDTRTLTYFELHREVVRFSAALLDLGVKAGDRIAIYMGMVPEAAIAMLACARIGATHSVVFGGFSAEALRDRINDLGATVLVTQDGAWRRGNVVPLKQMADVALKEAPSVRHVIVYERIGKLLAPFTLESGRDHQWDMLLAKTPSPESLAKAKAPDAFDAEHPLFVLYTSGSTGKPKGVLHTTAGYLAGAHVTAKYVFDLKDTDL